MNENCVACDWMSELNTASLYSLNQVNILHFCSISIQKDRLKDRHNLEMYNKDKSVALKWPIVPSFINIPMSSEQTCFTCQSGSALPVTIRQWLPKNLKRPLDIFTKIYLLDMYIPKWHVFQIVCCFYRHQD